MKKFVTVLVLPLLLLAACGSEKVQEEQETKKMEVKISKKEMHVSSGEAGTTAVISIDGMSCAIGCAKKIEKTLAGLTGVSVST